MNLLENLRYKKGYTQKYVANKIGVHQTTYDKWEKGKRRPSLDNFDKLSDFYKLSNKERKEVTKAFRNIEEFGKED